MKLISLVDVERPEPVYRVLGRNHYIINAPAESTENAALCALQDAVALDMVDYAQQAVDLYLSITGSQKLRHAPTPFCPERFSRPLRGRHQGRAGSKPR